MTRPPMGAALGSGATMWQCSCGNINTELGACTAACGRSRTVSPKFTGQVVMPGCEPPPRSKAFEALLGNACPICALVGPVESKWIRERWRALGGFTDNGQLNIPEEALFAAVRAGKVRL